MPYKFNPFTGTFDVVNAASTETAITGADLTGDDGDPNRTTTADSVSKIFVDGIYLHLTRDYTYVGTTITFLNGIWNEQSISIWS